MVSKSVTVVNSVITRCGTLLVIKLRYRKINYMGNVTTGYGYNKPLHSDDTCMW
jgi:hypothetical protein